jgi:hypothetical protein
MKRRLEKLIYPGAYYYVVAFWIIGMALNIGEMVSIRIPDEILEEGPGAVADYCAREFEQEQ